MTFLFTDIVGSTRLWETHPEAMRASLATHDGILRDVVASHQGTMVKTTGDGAVAAFADAGKAVSAAIDAQRALRSRVWSTDAVIAARMAVHTGVADERDGDYFGPTLNRAARLMAIGHGGQILVSHATAVVLGDVVELIDLGEHRLRDLTRPERVHQVVVGGLPTDHPALRSLDSLPTNLPVQLTSFIGRDDDLVRVAKAVAEHRLVTLTGVGGVGKTRLALHAGADLVADFAHGVWVTELAPAVDAEAMAGVVMTAFSIQARTGHTLEQSIVEALRHREVLWIIDNCEHLIAPAARLVDAALRACPTIRILATSREGLDVDGEHIIPLRSMELTDSSNSTAIAESDAVQLFVDRAVAVRPAFALTATNARDLSEIVRRLDGIPLAIELAAARIASVGVNELLDLLDQRFRVLTGGRRVALERHQTLRATVDWSYSLLTDVERAVFDRLSVFAGSFDTRAARAVAADESVDEWEVLEAVDGLVRKSMLTINEQSDGEVRFELLETIRQYGQEKLDAGELAPVTRRRHLDHYVERVQDIGRGLAGPEELESREAMIRELDNLRAAAAFALDVQDVDAVLAILTALEGERITGTAQLGNIALRALDVFTNVTGQRRQELLAAATVERYRGDHTGLDELVEEIGALGLDIHTWSSRVLRARSTPGMAPIDAMRQIADATHSWPVDLEATGSAATEESRRCVNIALACINTGDVELAQHFATASVELAHRGGSPSSIAQAVMQLGMAVASTDTELARTCFEECIALGRRGVRFMGRGGALMQLALIEANAGGTTRAAKLLAEAVTVMQPGGRSSELDGAIGYAIPIFDRLGLVDEAIVLIGAVLDGELSVLRTMPSPPSYQMPDVRLMRDRVGRERFAELVALGSTKTYDELLAHVIESLATITEPPLL